ncbi:MAG: cytochrome P450 [Dehalococcoidia bacterium]|nr:cytochrome P450 [Dehalococcoidia bacterium]
MPHASDLPTVGGLPVVGNYFEARRDFTATLQRFQREIGDAGWIQLGPSKLLLLNTPEYAQGVLVDHADAFEKSPDARIFLRAVAGNTLITMLNAEHRRERKMVAPAFQHRRVVSYADQMAAYSERLHRDWRDGDIIEADREMQRLTLWIVADTLFGADLLHDAATLGEDITFAFHHLTNTMRSLIPLPLSLPTPANRRYAAANRRLEATIRRFITERRASGVDRGDFLSILLRSQDEQGAALTDEQIYAECLGFFAAGHETTALATMWAFWLLSQHPPIYDRMQTELRATLQGRTPTYEDLARLPYTQQVLKEAMRLYPPAYIFGREAMREVVIDDLVIPKGALVYISPWLMHRRPDLFPDPETFNPDRFAGNAERGWPRLAYLPFGAGPRVCIGNHFAMMEGHLILATIGQRVRFHYVGDRDPGVEPLITLRPRREPRFRVERLDGASAPVTPATAIAAER